MRIAVGNDHVALELKRHIVAYLQAKGHTVEDFGTNTAERTDYPIYGERAARAVVSGDCDRAIVICGTGVGISLAANKVRGIRAVVCSEPYSAKLAVEHNNANVLAFGARVIGTAMAEMITDAFLSATFEGGRHQKRVDMLTAIEEAEYAVPRRD